MVSKFKVGLKPFLQQSLWGPEHYGDLVYKLTEVVSTADFSDQFKTYYHTLQTYWILY